MSKLSEEEIIKILDEELEKVNNEKDKIKVETFYLNMFDTYINELRDEFYFASGKEQALSELRHKIMEKRS